MKNIVKDLVRSTVISIGMALAIFCIMGVFFDIANGGNFCLSGHLEFSPNPGPWRVV